MKMTKKQRKAARGPNAAVRASLAKGDLHKLSSLRRDWYIGATPVYRDINAGKPGAMPHWVKLSAGVPFVRADRWDRAA